MSSKELLDRVQTLSSVEAIEADPSAYAAQLAAELSALDTLADLEARDALLATALRHIDDAMTRVMRLRLDRSLAADTSLATPTRKVFAATVVDYADDLTRLAVRARDVAARGGALLPDADAIATLVVEAAHATLELRANLRSAVLATIRELATATIPDADRHAKDRTLPDAERKRWSAARRDLEVLATDPAKILVAPMAARLAAWPEQIDEPPAESDPTFADMIELD